MIIAINQIDIVQAPRRENELFSYWIEFESALVSGQALLYSRTSLDVLLPGHQISVEIGQRDIEDFRLLLGPDQASLGKLIPLNTAGDYEAAGHVAILYEDVFYVDIESGWCSFAIAFDKINPRRVKEGDWVTFKVIGLELWDEHW